MRELAISVNIIWKQVYAFSRAWMLAFVSVWAILLVPVLTLLGKSILFFANIGQSYLDREQIDSFLKLQAK